ncbi:hypothetical protein BDV95DRAFT_478563 [Massariosphaeria phaeospora]|uniref:FAD-binding FR-type domain-containing protein n=1 Tax=Massariosphaeria phaeospora TaxID=100035 RepID=A0A7C8MJU2_9PLEO|nr:hypothetical protein BDV95DRAFT_478563 [Massariosphaeria phaeospora]
MSWILRPRAGALIVLGTSAIGGAAYRYAKSSSLTDASLNPHTFTPYTLADKQPVSSTSAIFTLRNPHGGVDSGNAQDSWARGVWSVQIKQPQLQIARAYTPLPPIANGQEGSKEESANVRLLIRQEKGGEVSTYLHRLPEQSTIELRGPNTEFQLPHDIREILFLAGGTGIAPAMQVAHALAQRTDSRMHILWANRRREECMGGISDAQGTNTMGQIRPSWWKSLLGLQPDAAAQEALAIDQHSQVKGALVQELEALKERSISHTRRLSVLYYVDEENTLIKPGDVTSRLKPDASKEKGSRLILVSGPDGFIEYWAGKKLWIDGIETQGPLGGVLGQLDLKDWSVFKL